MTSSATTASARGLSAAEARARLAHHGPNLLVPGHSRGRLRALLRPLTDPMVLLLLIAAPTYVAIGDRSDAIVTAAALVPIAAVGWVLESRAERTLERLREMTAPMATVTRDGRDQMVPATELVPGDLVSVREGDVVPADGQVANVTELHVDESALTGESLPVAKSTGGDGRLMAGTTVLSGRAQFVVTHTGSRTEYGSIGTLVASVRQPPTPLQRVVGRLVRQLAVVAAVFCTAVVVTALLRGEGLGTAVIAGVSLAIAAIPEEFPMVYTLYLALGAWRLAHHNALVRRLPGVETLGSTTVICTDKTGTLTEGRVAVAEVVPDGSGAGTEREVLTAAVLASEPDPFDPLELAIVDHARTTGVDVDALHARTLVTDWPFDAASKHLTHVWRDSHGGVIVAAKGSVEGILRVAAVDDRTHGQVTMANQTMADRGMRVLAIAAGPLPAPTGDRSRDEAALGFTGLIAFTDPLRAGVAEALAECRAAGVRVIMITGDHPATAHAIAESLDLPHEGEGGDLIATGDDIDRASPAELVALVESANVFARTRPEQKHQLVQALRQGGEVVAMTGDGINDAAALREADIGVAMGRRGTDVAREAATLVLLDDNFATIVAAVRDGRRIFDNLQRAFAYLVAFHPPLLIAALLVPLLDRPLLLLPIHLVVLEILLHPVVSLVFEADPAAADTMRRPPRRPGSGFDRRDLGRPLCLGITLGAAVVAAYLGALHAGWPTPEARSLGFVTLLLGQTSLVFVARSDEPLWRGRLRPTPTLRALTVLLLGTTVAVVAVRPLASLLHLAGLPAIGWVIATGAALVSTLWSEPLKHGH